MITREKADIVTRQILFNPTLHQSVGCNVTSDYGVVVGGKTIVRAGTPLRVDLSFRVSPAEQADGTTAMNAILLHDVDVTHGLGNGTACIFGFINLARVDAAVRTLITTARGNTDATKLITFLTEA